MKLEKIHVYYCIVQLIFSIPLLLTYWGVVSALVIRNTNVILSVVTLISVVIFMIASFGIGIVTLPYYFAKKIDLRYKTLSLLNLVVGISMLLFSASSYIPLFLLLSLITFIAGLYVFWKK